MDLNDPAERVVDSDIADLVRQERLNDAAHLASARGDAAAASALYERACAWGEAAAEALRAGEVGRALELAVIGGNDETAAEAIARFASGAPGGASVAERLSRKGHAAWAARVFEACGQPRDAARAWERAGDAKRAAALLESGGEPAAAARALEAALRRRPDAWGEAAALGALLVRFGKWEPAARVLQRVPAEAPERRQALASLVSALAHMGMSHAAAEAAAELKAFGDAPSDAAPELAPTHPMAPRTPAAPRLFGRYDVVREAASSPSARVIECVDVVRRERVALKLLAAGEARGAGRDALARFEREARAMKSLAHPNVAPVIDCMSDPPAIVLAWMEGGSLEQMLAAGPIAPARAVEIATAVLSALGEAHRLGIVHRDVKPANVLFDAAGAAHLTDFGVAHLGDASTTATAAVFGTLAYMSPEQRQGRPADVRSDLFSVGIMLRETITGERPTPRDIAGRRPSDAHRELDGRHDAAIARLTAADPKDRPRDAAEARALLESLPWPATVDDRRVAPRVAPSPPPRPAAVRLALQADGTAMDTWTGREIERVPLGGRALARARAFATADHPALQTIGRIDAAAGVLWLEALHGHAPERRLDAGERARLREAISALHRAGVVHGRIDAAHLVSTATGVVLRFAPEHDPTATADRDWIALGRL